MDIDRTVSLWHASSHLRTTASHCLTVERELGSNEVCQHCETRGEGQAASEARVRREASVTSSLREVAVEDIAALSHRGVPHQILPERESQSLVLPLILSIDGLHIGRVHQVGGDIREVIDDQSLGGEEGMRREVERQRDIRVR
jgi:hypothetical protein